MNNNYQFLNQIKQLFESHEKQRELSGENFNVFSIMSMESDEVFTHSAIIAELLNPKGSHSLGTNPLELFYEVVLKQECPADLAKFSCKKEEHIGFISEDKTEGGRLDIVVKDTYENGFVIENKIYAGEQINQLMRYKNKYKNATIIYLTLDGIESKQLRSIDGVEYLQISYETDIVNWITDCSKLSYDKPLLRETLKQYLYLIKKLTNQTTDIEMSKEIVDIINENFEASFEIYKNFQRTIEVKQNEILVSLLEKLKSKVIGWDIKEDIYKGTKCLILKKNEKLIRYRIKTLKHSAFSLEGLNQVDQSLIKLGFSENKKNGNIYWSVIDNDMDASKLINSDSKKDDIVKKIVDIVNILEPKKLLYIHGLGSDRNSRKFVNIKEYFKDQFEYNFVEWNNDSEISSLLNEAEKWLESKSTDQIVLVGDSTGANFAYQLREKLKQNNIKTILVLTSPLLNVENRTSDFEFPKNILPQLWKIENPEDALIIATQKDEVLNLIPLFEKSLKNIKLIDVDDSHRLLKFENYVHHIERYIQAQS